MTNTNRILAICSLLMAIGGLICVIMSIIDTSGDTMMLCIGLCSIMLANLFNIIRINSGKKSKTKLTGSSIDLQGWELFP